MWTVKTKVILVKTWATGITSKSFRQFLSCVPGNHTKELQKTVILGTAQILREVLM